MCKRWQGILKNPGHGSELWREVIIDFGHELITAVHTPIAWSDRRPSDEEFRYPALHLAAYTSSCTKQCAGCPIKIISARSCLPAIHGLGIRHMPQLTPKGGVDMRVALKAWAAPRRQSFAQTRLSATRMLHFVEERQQCVRRLVLMNSEGYWSGEVMPLLDPPSHQQHSHQHTHDGSMMPNRIRSICATECCYASVCPTGMAE